MTFDGDAAGLAVADRLAVAAERGVEVLVVVDEFALRVVSDTPARRASVRAEVARTKQMLDDLQASGCRVAVTHPYGRLRQFAIARNHKKGVVIDETAYVGGVNISDHNFAWHDHMFATTDPAIVAALADDIIAGADGIRTSRSDAIVTNTEVEATFDRLLAEAHQEILLASPYALDLALVQRLERHPEPRKIVVSGDDNNFALYRATRPYLAARARAAGTELWGFSTFSHAKFAVFDRRRMMVGSTNFDHHSFRANQEVALVIDDPQFVAAFRDDMLASAKPLNPRAASAFRRGVGAAAARAAHLATDVSARTVVPRVPPLARR